MSYIYKRARLITILSLFAGFLIFTQAQNNYYVNINTGSDAPANGTSGSPWRTIRYALSRVGDNSIINVAAGTYEEQPLVVSQNNLSLKGDNSLTTIISDTLTSASYPNNGYIYITGSGDSLVNFTIMGNLSNVIVYSLPQTFNEPYYGISVSGLSPSSTPANNLVISNIILEFFGKSGINITGGNGIIIDNVMSINNSGAGIFITDSHNITLSNVITNNNNWGGIGVGTNGDGYAAGISGILINGTNSFGESMGGAGMYFEEGNHSGGSPVPISYGLSSTSSSYNVNFSLQDFKYALTGPQDDSFNRIAFSDSIAQVIRAGYYPSQLGHFLTNGRITTYLGLPTIVTVKNSDLLHEVDFTGTDVSIIFTVLPPLSSANISVNELPGLDTGFTYPPALYGNLGEIFLQLSATGLTNYQFNALVTLNVTSIPGFDSTTKAVAYDSASGSWVLLNGTYVANDPYYHGHSTFTFSTNHFTNFFFVNNITTSGFYTVSLGNASTYSGSIVTVPVKINLNNNGGFSTFQSRFTFDPSKLQFTYATYGTGTLINQSMWAVLFQGNSGRVDMIGSGLNPLSTFNNDSLLFYLSFKVIDGNAGSAIIRGDTTHFFADEVSGLFNVISDTINYSSPLSPSNKRGDANGDFTVEINDVNYIVNHINGIVQITGQDSINADANNDGAITSEDIYYIMYYINYGTWPISPSSSPSANLALNTITYASKGLIDIPITLFNTSKVNTIELYFIYDPKLIDYQSFKQEMISSGYFVNANELSAGHAKFIFASSSAQKGNILPGNIYLRFIKGDPAIGSELNTQYSINGGPLQNGPTIVFGVTGVDQRTGNIPATFSVSQNYPNPFNPSTVINYNLPKSSFVSIKVYDMLGRVVKTLVNSDQPAGSYYIQWNGDNNLGEHVASGAYIYRVMAGNNAVVKKMLLLK